MKKQSGDMTDEELGAYDLGYERNQFNQWISDQMPMERWAYDTRDIGCLKRKYVPNPVLAELAVSVIIIFHNEARSTLLRTARSVLSRTPPELVKEIILVDDGSTFEHLHAALDADVARLDKTRVLRLADREGLIRAKVAAAEVAEGKVMVFLDSHCECNDGWLEPLLDRIKRNRRTVAMPIIDAIDYETWEWRTGTLERGVFDWAQHFFWMPLRPEDMRKRKSKNTPFKSPAMAGGLFAMDRDYFFEVGAYDPDMDVWGGENIEMSLRIWMCGGQLEVVPCSHVAHVFREKTPYSFKSKKNQDGDPAATIGYNLNRVAEVWLDGHKDKYYAATANRKYGHGDVSGRTALRQQLKCRDFDWFLENVFPDLAMMPAPIVDSSSLDPFAEDEEEEERGGEEGGDPFAEEEEDEGDPFADEDEEDE